MCAGAEGEVGASEGVRRAGQGGGGVEGGGGSQYSLLYSARPLPCMCLVQP